MRMLDVRLIEDLADLVADRVVDALHVELGGERLLHAVDDRELGRALLALLEQALRLVEQARVFERDAHRCWRASAAGARPKSLNACSRSMSIRLMSPRAWSPATSGT